ncbi:hypothetical protein FQN54_005826 [Arachnomyces sp. PD_36]|nr:hypothetical protein FQN54_005826 [Arachnomyces sp. PD_36]
MISVQTRPHIPTAKVDISLLLKPQDEEEEEKRRAARVPHAPRATTTSTTPPISTSTSITPPAPAVIAPSVAPVPNTSIPPLLARATSVPAPISMTPTASAIAPSIPAKRLRSAHPAESPAKKQSKWSADEDALIIELRGSGMKWEDISKRLPGRSAISCRLHYQNYLERRSEWDEDRKNKLARLYERFKPEMWAKIAEEMAIPWRAAEAMHWQLGEQEMARRAGVVPFSLSSATPPDPSPRSRRGSTAMPRIRRESGARLLPPQQLPSVAELTSGVSAYAPPRELYPTSRSPPDLGRIHPGLGRRR